jgi:formylglycine-generating enzyme required for sulfatase activity
MRETPAPALDLGALVERLRAAGFRVDTRQYLTAHELLLAYAAAGVHLGRDARRLTACLGPIFCTSPDEQERFATEVAEWLQIDGHPSARAARTAGAAATPFQPWKRARWWVGPIVALAVIAVVCGLLAARYYLPVDVHGAVQVQLEDGRVVPPSEAPGAIAFVVDGAPAPLGGDGTFVVRVARARVVTVEASLEGFQPVRQELSGGTSAQALLTLMRPPTVPTPAPRDRTVTSREAIGVALPGQTATRRIRWPVVALGALATTLIALGVLAAIDRFRRRLALGQLPVQGDPEAITLAVPEQPVLPASELDLRRAAIALRKPRDSHALDLDIDDTVDVTVRHAGFFQPRYSARRSMPEYVVLISRRTPADHQARTFDVILKHLADQDVLLDTYSFVDDPRTCASDHTGESFALRAVLERHHRATVIVAAETLCAFNRVTGTLAPWVETVRSHERRIFVTTEAPDRWTDREGLLEQAGFIVLPATEGGWRVLANVDSVAPADVLFPAPYTRPYPGVVGGDELRWLDRNEPPPDELELLLRDLRSFLGPDGFAWMCACAVYPEISWALTLRVKGTERAATLLPSMSRLPWFRHGFMPVWLRRALVAQLPRAEDQRLRTDLERLLEELAMGPSRSESGSALQIGRFVGPIDLLRAAPAGSPLQDRVFLGFMAGERDALWLDAPQALRRLFRQAPASIPGTRQASIGLGELFRQAVARIRVWHAMSPMGGHMAAAAAIGLISLAPLTQLLTIDEITGSPQSLWFVEVPNVEMPAPSPDGILRNVRVGNPFFLSRTEVTVGEYHACVADGACAAPGPTGADQFREAPDWPVRNVSFREAQQYAAWLHGKLTAAAAPGPIREALAGRRDGVGWEVTLPTETQWAMAATGGENRRFPWGNDVDPLRANLLREGYSFARVAPVGSFPRDMSPFGIVDMAGNVAEWIRPASPAQSASGGIRGGSFNSTASEAEQQIASTRISGIDSRDEATGFRVAIAPISPPVPESTSPSTNALSPEPAPANRAPTIRGISQSPAGIGLPPTEFTLSADGVADPNGDALTYVWNVAGESRRSTSATTTVTFGSPGTHPVSVTVTDAGGATATASTDVEVGTLTGTWNITCTGGPKAFPSFPTTFVARITQDGSRVSGMIEGGGRSQTFPAPSSLENTIRSPRSVSFGVEGYYNVWADRDGDFYFNVTLDERLQTMTGTSQYCESVRGVRARAAAMKK